MSHHDRYDSGHAKHKPEFREMSREEKHLLSRSEARRILAQTDDLAIKAEREKVIALRAALEKCVVLLRRMDTQRHLDPQFPALDEAEAVLKQIPP